MIEQSGTVVSSDNGLIHVRVAVDRQCARCEQGQGCGQGFIGRPGAADTHYTLVRTGDSFTPSAGQCVVLGVAPRALLLASALVYLWPLVSMTLVAVAAHYLGPGSETVTSIAGVAGLFGGFVAVHVLAGRNGLRQRLEPRLVRMATSPAEGSVT